MEEKSNILSGLNLKNLGFVGALLFGYGSVDQVRQESHSEAEHAKYEELFKENTLLFRNLFEKELLIDDLQRRIEKLENERGE